MPKSFLTQVFSFYHLDNFRFPVVLMLLLAILALAGKSFADDENQILNMPNDTIKVLELIRLGEEFCSIENDRSLLYLQEAMTIATSQQFDKGVGLSLLWQGRVFYYKDDYMLAYKYYEKAEAELLKSNDTESLVLLYFFKGEICRLRGDYINAMKNYEQVLELIKTAPNMLIGSASYTALGIVLINRKDPQKGLEYLREGLRQKIEIEDENGEASVLCNIGAAYECMEEYDSALYYYDESLSIRKKLDISRVIASSEYTVGGLLIKLKRYDEAIENLEDARLRFAELDEKTGVIITNLCLAKAMSYKGEPKGEELGRTTLSNAIALDNLALVSEAHKTLAEIYSHLELYKESYEHLLRHKHIEDSIFSEDKERILTEFEQKFQSEQKDNKIAILKNEGEYQRQNIILLSVSSFTLLAIIILLFILFRYKSLALKKNALLLEQENMIHTQDSKLKENENRILQEQLESKNRELASKALEMIRFNDTISAIIEKLDGLDTNFNAQPESSRHIRSIIHELESQSKQNLWIEFDKIFKNIHTDFYAKLLERCPDLTPTEIKTAALLKLNLTTKEIAAITFKSEGGIKTTRYRLRKKLELSSDEKLIPFLMKF
jgi:tetratricopeptide (TPR) repeat protein